MNNKTKGLWGKEQENDFFESSLKIATPEQLFYTTDDRRYLAYWPKGYSGKKDTLQSRNAFIGNYTEKWSKGLFEDVAKEIRAHVVQGVICDELGLTKKSPADLAICNTESR